MKRQSAVEKELRRQIEVLDEEMNALTRQIDDLITRRTTMFDFRCDLDRRIRYLNTPLRKIDSNVPQ